MRFPPFPSVMTDVDPGSAAVSLDVGGQWGLYYGCRILALGVGMAEPWIQCDRLN